MTRTWKIVLTISAIIISIVTITGTILYAKENITTQTTNTSPTDMGTPPAKPEGESTTTDTQTPPAKPDGEDNNAPTQPGSTTTSAQLTMVYIAIIAAASLLFSTMLLLLIMTKSFTQSAFVNGDKIFIYILLNILLTAGITFGLTYLTNNYILNGSTDTTQSNTQENSNTNTTSAGAHTLTNNETATNTTFTSTTSDEYAVLADGVTATLNNITVNKSGDSSSTENSSFYGLNSGVFATNGAILTITDSEINASGAGANGVFAYGTGKIIISDSIVNADSEGAGGIQVSGGGTLEANNLTVTSTGKAAIRSDRGGGTMTVDGGTYTTTGGNGAPAIYSTADITASDATLTAQQSQAVIIEGKNSVTLTDCIVSGNDNESTGNIFLYQSMSGDAEEGTSEFSMTGGSIASSQAIMFGVTNTDSVINLDNVTLNYSESTKTLLSLFEGRWGTSGSNGGTLEFNATEQLLTGNIEVSAASDLNLTLTSSTLTSTVNTANTGGEVNIKLDKDSIWNVTGTSYVTVLTDADTTYNNIKSNGYTIYYDSDSNTTLNGKTITLSGGGKLVPY